MQRKYLGDTYDSVKRLWGDLLLHWAPLFADCRFIPNELQTDFTRMTGIPMLRRDYPEQFSILNDPDTGIRLPADCSQATSRTHTSVESIATQLRTTGAFCVVTFDQSDYRNSGLSRKQQRECKMSALMEFGFHSFYYVSHAPFLFSTANQETLERLRAILLDAGIPAGRLELLQPDA